MIAWYSSLFSVSQTRCSRNTTFCHIANWIDKINRSFEVGDDFGHLDIAVWGDIDLNVVVVETTFHAERVLAECQ